MPPVTAVHRAHDCFFERGMETTELQRRMRVERLKQVRGQDKFISVAKAQMYRDIIDDRKQKRCEAYYYVSC